jgi:hypothetical protein
LKKESTPKLAGSSCGALNRGQTKQCGLDD